MHRTRGGNIPKYQQRKGIWIRVQLDMMAFVYQEKNKGKKIRKLNKIWYLSLGVFINL